MTTSKTLTRAAVAVIPTAAVVASTLSFCPQALATSPNGQVNASNSAFTYRAPADAGLFYFDADVTETASGYDLFVNPEGIDFSGSCVVPPPTNGIPSQVYVCAIPEAADINLTGKKNTNDYISLLAHPDQGRTPFTVPATIRTSGGDDRISTSSVIAKLNAGKGDDLINTEVAAVPDTLTLSTPRGDVQGGRGTDTVTYADAVGVTLRISLDGRANDGRPGEKDNIHSDVENLIAPTTGFTAIGSNKANVLTGGKSGDDSLVGRGGKDTLIGQGGNDRLDARDGTGGDIVSCGGGNDRVWLDQGDKMVNSRACERVTYN